MTEIFFCLTEYGKLGSIGPSHDCRSPDAKIAKTIEVPIIIAAVMMKTIRHWVISDCKICLKLFV